ncbi:sulfotransferase [Paracoccus sp. SY]|uniref:sulfotransferase n=1 Tax=Paracoccus sp. SY TaxID=1330255 RepID=UPI000CD1140B|nr:sulfotransferase [Paracoccus sp. SY]
MTQTRAVSNKPTRPGLIVLGMHRSGTSALAGVLGHMGMGLPHDLMPAEEMNARGFFESNVITTLDEELLASAGMTWWAPQRFPRDWLKSDAAYAFAARAHAALDAEYGEVGPFVMKDPRLCRLMPFWLPVLHEARCRPLMVLTYRHPDEVSASLNRWAGYDRDYAVLLWLRHVLDAEADTRGEARCFTNYEALLTDWRTTVTAIGDRLGLDWPRDVDTAAAQVQAFLSRELQHFDRTGSSEFKLPDWVSSTLEIMDRWARDGEQEEDHAVLDALRRDLDRASQTFLPMARKTQALTNETRHLRDRIRDTNAECQRLQADLIGARNSNEVLDTQLRAALNTNAENTQSIATNESRVATLATELQNARQAEAQARKQIEVLTRQGSEADAASHAAMERHACEVTELQAAAGIRQALLDEVQAALVQLQKEHEALGTEAASSRDALDSITREADDLREKLANLQAAFDSAEAALAQLREDHEALGIEAADNQNALAMARSALEQRSHENDELYAQVARQKASIEQGEAALQRLQAKHKITTEHLARASGRLNRMTARMAVRMRANVTQRLADMTAPLPGPTIREQELEAELAVLHRQMQAQVTELRNHQAQLAEHNNERVILHQQLEDERSASSALRIQANAFREQELEAELAVLHRQMQAQLAELRNHQAQIAEHNNERVILHQQLEDERSASSALRIQVNALMESTSWRVTGPMRRVSSLMRRVRGK